MLDLVVVLTFFMKHFVLKGMLAPPSSSSLDKSLKVKIQLSRDGFALDFVPYCVSETEIVNYSPYLVIRQLFPF